MWTTGHAKLFEGKAPLHRGTRKMTDTQDVVTRLRRKRWPVLNAAFAAGAGYYALTYGISTLPPFVALMLVGAMATVAFRLVEELRSRFDNVVVSFLSATSLMVSILSGISLLAWVLWSVLSADQSPVDRVLSAKSTFEQVVFGAALVSYVFAAFLGFLLAVGLLAIVRTDAFGPKSDA